MGKSASCHRAPPTGGPQCEWRAAGAVGAFPAIGPPGGQAVRATCPV